jgi:endonuclease/exonuclease/phosphatase family metal-dependent hydrolase
MHLHDGASAERESLRADQIAAVLAWMSAREADADGGCVLLGDLNAAPHEKAHELLSAHGFAVRCGQT